MNKTTKALVIQEAQNLALVAIELASVTTKDELDAVAEELDERLKRLEVIITHCKK